MSEQPVPQPTWDGPAEPVYANAMSVNGGAFDVMLIFGLMQAAPANPGQAVQRIGEVARVSMSWGHVKSMIPLLAKMVADYESTYGEVPAPGFGDNWKG